MCTTKKVNMINVDDSEYPTADREYKKCALSFHEK